jgi:putative LysE/RhtB family amino acid efflux pump
VAQLLLVGLLVGAIVASPIGPVGTATLTEMLAGNYRKAFAGTAGCVAAELVLALIAVFGVIRFHVSLGTVPPAVNAAVGWMMLLIGFYYLVVQREPQFNGVTAFLVAFKLTLLSPNNLAAILALIVAFGMASLLDSPTNAAVFLAGEFFGVILAWLCLLGLGWRLRQHAAAKKAIPWMRRATGILMLVAGSTILAQLSMPAVPL